MYLVVVNILAWIGASGFALILCVTCTIGSIILWARGLAG